MVQKAVIQEKKIVTNNEKRVLMIIAAPCNFTSIYFYLKFYLK